MCSLCGDPRHDDMRCPCFGYSGGEYSPPVDVPRSTDSTLRQESKSREFSTSPLVPLRSSSPRRP